MIEGLVPFLGVIAGPMAVFGTLTDASLSAPQAHAHRENEIEHLNQVWKKAA
jgi:hypothetical protein